jgi:hypothetical protein
MSGGAPVLNVQPFVDHLPDGLFIRDRALIPFDVSALGRNVRHE